MPALVVVVLMTVLVVGPSVSTLPPAAYFRSPVTWRYLGENLVLWTDHLLPGVFQSLPYPYSVNASLWTLPIEVCLYASTLVIAPLAVRFGRVAWATIMGIAFAAALLWDRHPYALHHVFDAELYSFHVYDALGYLPTYLLGSVFAAMGLDEASPVTARRTLLAALGVLIVAILVPHRFPLTLMVLPVTVATLYTGLGQIFDFAFMRRIGDISYGTYLWGFIVQQSVLWLTGPAGGVWRNVAISLPVAWVLGFVSWRLVERPMLRLKRHPRALVFGASAASQQDLAS